MSYEKRYLYGKSISLPPDSHAANGPEGKKARTEGLAAACPLVLSAALFGAVSAGSFYGVGKCSRRARWKGTLRRDWGGSYHSGQHLLRCRPVWHGCVGHRLCRIASVVAITNISVQEVRSYFNRFGPNGAGQTQLEETTSCGSGVIIANDGTYLYMVTNQHVVANATTLSVSFCGSLGL